MLFSDSFFRVFSIKKSRARFISRSLNCKEQSFGSVTFWYGSGSLPLTNGSGFGSGSFYFRQRPSIWQILFFLFKSFFCLLLFQASFTSFFKDKKVIQKSQSSRNQVFSYNICMIMEGCKAGAVPGTNISGSGRPKKTYVSYGSGSATLIKILRR
jgi:hypothetical protein